MARDLAQHARDREIVLAWNTAALSRAKKLPALKTLLAQSHQKVQTMGEQRAMLALLSERYGIPLRKTRLIKKAS